MTQYDWSDQKNEELKKTRGVSFEQVVFNIEQGNVLDIVDHPNQAKYPGQQMMIIKINDYAHLVPFIESEGRKFFKTIVPSRKATKRYLGDL